jgi:hypothetical protein
MNSQKVEMLRSFNQIESTIRPPVNSLSMFIAALTAMGSGETVQRALYRAERCAPNDVIKDAEELIDVLHEIGEGVTALKLERRLAELREGQSSDAIAGLWELVDMLPHDAYMAFGFAVESAQIRCGEHPNPQELLADIDFDREGFRFGSAWQFWGNRSPEAIRTAREAFIAALLHAAGLSDEPDYPEPLAD